MAANVYYMNDRAGSVETSLVAKMLTVFDAAALGEMIQPGDIVGIKMHCGEYNNTAYLRPVYPRALADKIKSLGGRPFVCDTTTLPYFTHPSRSTALDELLTAERNGINSTTLGCPFIVADGFIGLDDMRVDLPEGYMLKEQYVARAIALADVLIVLTHFKGHAGGVIGGSIKNIGIGAASQRGKHCVHMGCHPRHGLSASYYYPHLCSGRAECPQWELCEASCPYGLIQVTEHSVEMDRTRCDGCAGCVSVISSCGVLGRPEEAYDVLNAAIADSALACMKAVGRDKMGFINLAIDITPNCDCAMFSDRPIVPNIGVFASKDPVALDRATLDKTIAAVGIPGSLAEDRGVAAAGMEKFPAVSSVRFSSQDIQINTGHLNGLGSKDYTLVEVPPGARDQFLFHWDRRPIAQRLARLYTKSGAYPLQGFKRLEDVDLEKVR